MRGEATWFHSCNYPLDRTAYSVVCKKKYVSSKSTNTFNLINSHLLVIPTGLCCACTMGLHPCTSTSLLIMGNRPELCVLVQIVPQIDYYDGPPGRVHLDSSLEGQHERAAQILVPVMVGIGITGSAAIRPAALSRQL